MKKFLILIFIMFSFGVVSAYELTPSDYNTSKIITEKIEKNITKKGETYRVKYLNALNKLKNKYSSERIKSIINDVISNLNSGDIENEIENIISSNTDSKGTIIKNNKVNISSKKIIPTSAVSKKVEGLTLNGNILSWNPNGENKYLLWITFSDGSNTTKVVEDTKIDTSDLLKIGNNNVCVYGDEKMSTEATCISIDKQIAIPLNGCNHDDIIIGTQVWSACNIGSNEFLDKGSNSVGTFFQWGSIDNDFIQGKILENDSWGDVSNNLISRKGPCNDGYHVPTKNDIENAINLAGGLGNFKFLLGLPNSGRIDINGNKIITSDEGFLWTSSTSGNDNAFYFSYSADSSYLFMPALKSLAYNVRCIKN